MVSLAELQQAEREALIALRAYGHLFDRPPDAQATRAYLADERNCLLLAYLDDGTAAGFVRGTELRRFDGRARRGRRRADVRLDLPRRV